MIRTGHQGEQPVRVPPPNAGRPAPPGAMLALATAGFAVTFWAWALLSPLAAALRHAKGIQAAGLPAGPGDAAPVTQADLDRLPGVAQQYLNAMGVVGKPRAWSFRPRQPQHKPQH